MCSFWQISMPALAPLVAAWSSIMPVEASPAICLLFGSFLLAAGIRLRRRRQRR
jgi:hypothetical protein